MLLIGNLVERKSKISYFLEDVTKRGFALSLIQTKEMYKMYIKSIKKAYLALATSLTMIVGVVNAVENIDPAKPVSDAPVSNTSEKELTTFEEFLIVLGLKKENEEVATLGSKVGGCTGGDECRKGKVKH
jgi:hypothetical protein